MGKGEGVAKDTTSAVAFYHQSAEGGYAPAEYQLGEFLQKGETVSKVQLKPPNGFKAATRKGMRELDMSWPSS